MKIPKCYKTVSKKHMWRPMLLSNGLIWQSVVFAVDGDQFGRKCIACGIVDDNFRYSSLNKINDKN